MRASAFEVPIGDRVYLVEEPVRSDGLKATITVFGVGDELPSHADRLNLDRARARTAFAETAGTDPDDLLLVREAVLDALTPAPAVDPSETSEDDARAVEAGGRLLRDPCLLALVADVVRRLGYAGGEALVQLLFLVFVSRFLARPVNVVVTGPSGAGKSFVVNRVGTLFPPDAIHHLTGMSERALAYTDADLRHRYLVVGEASAMHQDGVGASMLRTVAWEGRVVYETVEQAPDGRMGTRRIDKPGPTGFITTTTRVVEEELGTRVLTVHVNDTPEATRLILRATAARHNGHLPDPPDLAPWHALQRRLEAEGAREVTIPYVEQLAELVPDRLVRMRRDFVQLLALLQAHALLFQFQRERDASGRIVATEADYAAVYALTRDLFGSLAAEGVTPAIRETVAAVTSLTTADAPTATLRRVAEELGIGADAAKKRVGRALRQGWLVNDETRPRQPLKLRPGDPLPREAPALPSPDELFADALVSPVSLDGATPDFPRPEAERLGSMVPSPVLPQHPEMGATGNLGTDWGSRGRSPAAPRHDAETGSSEPLGTLGTWDPQSDDPLSTCYDCGLPLSTPASLAAGRCASCRYRAPVQSLLAGEPQGSPSGSSG